MKNKDSEIQLLKIKLKKMEQEKKAINRRLAKAGITDIDISEEVNEVSEEENKSHQNHENQSDNSNQNGSTSEPHKYEISEAELKEIEVLKYKNEQEMDGLKKEYEHQLEIINFKVSFSKTLLGIQIE